MTDTVVKHWTIDQLLTNISKIDTIGNAVSLARDSYRALGANRFIYHLTPKLRSQIDPTIQLIAEGFSAELMTLYETADFRERDPIPETIMHSGVPMRWSEAIARAKLELPQVEFLEKCKTLGLVDGMGFPLFGPNGRNGYAAFTFKNDDMLYDKALIAKIAAVTTAGHLRICKLLDEREQCHVELSHRENQVLQFMANGLSNREISHRLDVGSSTTDTYVRRVFSKLGVNERTSASIRALELGILRL